ncbi:fibrobacter succinogenes major paralogous domain-containing protein [Flavobacterium sp. CYK-55]|uniref:fibrobacter succinogenes major paralogous domain-containing protein n=1 Tax=Flavobacterium sp. CYK-55 TaxID=2835529 RepID=UPI001BD075ED|nr:fibrobacter succinogenes major paralogous domain-containing protein [Flavobacterium sp. CYK-55]MBS7786934.1 fibrobacter succinogenes major paralogous domain-containing protein [Flavobacterium sp. CYK-55]
MKKYFSATLIFSLVIVVISCSQQEDNKSQTQPASRPSVPVQAGEVQIGTQIWMTKNLNVSRYRNGDPIPQVSNPTQWANLTTGAWCYYANNSANGTIYGKLYNWYAVNDPRGLAPQGWHIPSDVEWTTLVSFLGFADFAGGKMKTTGTLQSGTGLWRSPNTAATNSSGFSALPGGYVADNGSGSFLLDKYGYWWSTTEFGSQRANARILNYTDGGITTLEFFKDNGFSVRCIKD